MNPRPSPSPNHGKMPIRVTALAYDLCILYYRNLCTLTYSSLSNKISGKEGDCKSYSISSQWILCSPTVMGAVLSPHIFALPWAAPIAPAARSVTICFGGAGEVPHALQRKSHLCIPFLGTTRSQFQFPHSCVCERFIYSRDWSTYFLQ